MTEFYASKVHHKVSVPNGRVRAAKFQNPVMPSGVSYAVQAGKDNGVVDQRLSRFAKQPEADALKPAPGNQNWYNHKTGEDFVKPKEGHIFQIKRPAFRSSEIEPVYPEAASIDNINQRRGGGNWNIERPAFLAPDIAARPIQGLKTDYTTEKVASMKLDETTLNQLFQVKIPDSTDVQWLAEKARLEAMYAAPPFNMTGDQIKRVLESNKPLGREQRTETKSRNIGQSELSVVNKLKELKEEIQDGKAQSMVQQAQLMGQFALVLADTNAIAALTQAQLTNLGADLARLGAPKSYLGFGLPHRFVDNHEYKADAGRINTFIYSQLVHNIAAGLDGKHPVFDFANHPATGIPGYPIQTLAAGMGAIRIADRKFLDLERLGVIDQTQLKAFAAAAPGGFSNPLFAIDPENQK